jgi:hypothetical protein
LKRGKGVGGKEEREGRRDGRREFEWENKRLF